MVKIRPDEISSVIRQQIEQYTQEAQVVNVGTVLSVGDGIARIYGLEKAMAGELLEFQDGTIGVALNLESDNVGAVLMGDGLAVQEGDSVKATGKIAQVPVGEAFLGRVVDGLARPIDGKGDIKADGTRLIESPAPGIIARRSVYEPLQTGLVSIDAMIPIGRGQRELIIGDRQTGKTAVATDTIINQKGGDCICVYVAIGQKASTVAQIVTTLAEADAMSYTIVVAENANAPATLQYLAPYTGASLAEYSCTLVVRHSSFMMTFRSKRKLTVKCHFSLSVLQGVRHTLETFSTFTHVYLSVQRSLTMLLVKEV